MADNLNTAAQPAAEAATPPSGATPTVVFGRFMLPDMSEHPCQVASLSLSKVRLLTTLDVPVGVQIVAYIEEFGRIEGRIAQHIPGGFELAFELNEKRRERFKTRLKWLRDKATGNAEEARRHPRYEPADAKSHITLPDGRTYPCQVIDISLSGAALTTDVLPALGTTIMLGKMKGRVVRYLPNGLAIEFAKPLDQSTLQSHIS
jgi:hypothetical protein